MENDSSNQLSEKAVEAAYDVVDIISEQFFQHTPLKYAKAVHSIYSGIRESIFQKNFQAFITNTQQLTEYEKEKFLLSLKDEKDTFFKSLWIVIDRIDDERKAEVLGRLFTATVEGKLGSYIFRQLCNVIDNMFFDDINALYNQTLENGGYSVSTGGGSTGTVLNLKLVAFGLIGVITPMVNEMQTTKYIFADLGVALINFGFTGKTAILGT